MTSLGKPLVTVIIPSYNYARSLGPCIESVLNQTQKNLEIIVIDDHSTDNSLAIARGYPVITLQSEVNGGVAAARNLGVSRASADVLFFVDADVVLDAGAIDAALVELASDPTIVSVCGIYEPRPLFRDSLWEEFRSLQAYVWRASSLGDVSAGFFSLGAIRASAFAVIGPFNVNLRQTEEIDYGERLCRHGRIVLTDLVRGRHDDDHQFLPMMKKFWRRSRDRVPFYLKRRAPMKGFESPRRLGGTLLTALLWMTLLIAVWQPTIGLAAVFAVIAAIVFNERDTYLEAFRVLGAVKLPLFFLWYLAFHTAAGLGVLTGLWKYATSRQFRNLYGDWDARAAVS